MGISRKQIIHAIYEVMPFVEEELGVRVVAEEYPEPPYDEVSDMILNFSDGNADYKIRIYIEKYPDGQHFPVRGEKEWGENMKCVGIILDERIIDIEVGDDGSNNFINPKWSSIYDPLSGYSKDVREKIFNAINDADDGDYILVKKIYEVEIIKGGDVE